MGEQAIKPADGKLIATRHWLNEKLVDWDEGHLPENIDDIWFEGWKDFYPRIERSDLVSQEIFHKNNEEALLVATFRRYLETD